MNTLLFFIFLFKGIISAYIYLGIERYGEINRTEALNPESQVYRFMSNNKEIKFKIYPGDIINSTETGPNYSQYKCEDGAYPIQNKLVEGYEYKLTIKNDYIVNITQITNIKYKYTYKPPISYIPGLRTLKNFISTAFQPVGTTLYVFGGGWDFQDLGTSYEGRTIGISQNWVKFFDDQNTSYTYRDDAHPNNTYYPFGEFNQYYYAGLDCSGFVGWSIYNTIYNDSLAHPGFVTNAKKIANNLEKEKYGIWMHTVNGSTYSNPNYTLLANELKVGDILSTSGHVMIVLGKCNDGSFIILHSTPSNSKSGSPGGGVQMSAVNTKESGSTNCEAYKLCEEFMNKYFKKWSERYNVVVTATETVFNFKDEVPTTGLFHWDLTNGIITDPDNYTLKNASEILKDLFENEKSNSTEPSDPSDSSGPSNPSSSSGKTILYIAGISLVVIVLAVIIFILIRKRRKNNNIEEIGDTPLVN
jgi:hypothetical protein